MSTVVRRKTSKHFGEIANLASQQCVTIRQMNQSGSHCLSRVFLALSRCRSGCQSQGPLWYSPGANEAQTQGTAGRKAWAAKVGHVSVGKRSKAVVKS